MADLFRPVAPDEKDEGSSLVRKLLWFAGLAIASGTVVAVTAYILRGLLFL